MVMGAMQPVLYRRGNSLRTTRCNSTATSSSECREGKVYRQKEPQTLIRIVGQALPKVTVFEMESALQRLLPDVHRGGAPGHRRREV